MSQAVEILQQEIAKRQQEIAALQSALDCLQGKPVKPAKQLALPAPKNVAGINEYDVNGHTVRLGPKLAQVFEAVSQAEDCTPMDDLLPLYQGTKQYVQQAVSALNKKLRGAGAEIVYFKGEGYRLQNIEDGA